MSWPVASSPRTRRGATTGPAFHHEIYRRQVERESTVGRRSFISDRGTVDAFAFHPESLDQLGTTLEREYARYTAVIQLGSAAAIGPPYYVTDTIRNESVDEARKIERAITSAWKNHPGYLYIDAGVAFEVKYAAFRHAVMEYSIRVNI